MDISVAILQLTDAKLHQNKRNGSFILDQYNAEDYEIALVDAKTLAGSTTSSTSSENSVDFDPLEAVSSGIASDGSPRSSPLGSRENLRGQPPLHSASQKSIKRLPKSRTVQGNSANPAEVVMRMYSLLFRHKAPRATAVSVWSTPATTMTHAHGTKRHPQRRGSNSPQARPPIGGFISNSCQVMGSLYCVPVLSRDKCQRQGKTRFYPLMQVLSMCHNNSPVLDPEARHLLLRLEEWLQERHKNQNGFLDRLFIRPPGSKRILRCVHNPAHVDETKSCLRRASSLSSSPKKDEQDDSELRLEDRRANETLVHMMELEKCDIFIMNALFGSGLPYRVGHGQKLTQYFARNRPDPKPVRPTHSVCPSDSSIFSDSGSWMDDFPLHKYAYLGNSEAIRYFLSQGYDPDQLDRDSWAPIHYSAWYGQLAAVQTLINYGNCSVNIRNRNGSTPLHFASWCGHQYVVELLLSHPDIQSDAKDKDGKLPLDLCDCVPKPEWQAVARLLRAIQKDKLPKIQIDLMDGSNVMVALTNESDTTAAQILIQICEELRLNESCSKIFALWICSESLQLQLKADQKPLKHLGQWKSKVLTKLSDCADPNSETPRLFLRRDAKLSLSDEKRVKLTDTALSLLFHEAHKNYIAGLYPCADHDAILLAATYLQIVHGNYDAKRDKHYLANDKTLSVLLPYHKQKNKSMQWVQKIINEHKYVTSKGSKNILGLQYQFLSFCWNLRVYGSAFFNATVYMNKPVKGYLPVHVGVNDFGLHLIKSDTKDMFQSYPHKHLEWAFGGMDRPYIEIKTRAQPFYHLTLQTRQASLINTLLNKINEGLAKPSTSATSFRR